MTALEAIQEARDCLREELYRDGNGNIQKAHDLLEKVILFGGKWLDKLKRLEEFQCPRCEGTGVYERLALPPTDCAVCEGTGILQE